MGGLQIYLDSLGKRESPTKDAFRSLSAGVPVQHISTGNTKGDVKQSIESVKLDKRAKNTSYFPFPSIPIGLFFEVSISLF